MAQPHLEMRCCRHSMVSGICISPTLSMAVRRGQPRTQLQMRRCNVGASRPRAAPTFARQSSGRRLIAAYDPQTPTSRPGIPSVTTRRVGNVVHLGWSEADNGNSPITGYKIMRGTASGGETLLTNVSGTQSGYDDTTATDTSKTYYYKVLAVNAAGASCGANEVAAPY